MKKVIESGKGIEINTSSFRYGLPDFMPSTDVLKLYLELGRTIITIGSDSHQAEHLGAYIRHTKDFLRQIGYKTYCTFENMQAMHHSL